MTKDTAFVEIIQLSDPHLTADEKGGLYGLNSLHALELVIDLATQQSFDLALVTGDLVHDESEAGYRLLNDRLKRLATPVHLTTGNHDDAALLSKVVGQDGITCGKVAQLGAWQVVLLNSQVPGQVGGFLDERELTFLERQLETSEADYCLIAVHHHPIPMGNKWLDPIGLANADKLFEIIARFPQVRAVIWGHVHQALEQERAGVKLMSVPSTCIQFKPGEDQFMLDEIPPGYRWLKLFDDGEIETGIKRLTAIPGTLDPDTKGY